MTTDEQAILDALIGREPTKLEWERHPPLAALRRLTSSRDRLREALEVAADLLRGEGYDGDQDYRQEWLTVSDALGPVSAGPEVRVSGRKDAPA